MRCPELPVFTTQHSSDAPWFRFPALWQHKQLGHSPGMWCWTGETRAPVTGSAGVSVTKRFSEILSPPTGRISTGFGVNLAVSSAVVSVI